MNSPTQFRYLITAFLCLLSFSAALISSAADFPNRPIKLVVPFPPGGGSDTAARLLKRAISENGAFSQPFVIENVPGGGGTIGSRRVKNAAPDGHTLLLLHEGMFTARQSGQATYGAEAFEPVASFGRTGTILAVSEKSPLRSLQDLIDHCRDKPDSLTFACNLGAPAHFIGLQIQKAAGDIRFRFVPSGGGAKRYGDLIGGEVEATIFSTSEFAAFQGGGIRALAFLGSKRHPQFDNVPTATEQGVPLVTGNIQFVWAPANTPDDIIASIGQSIDAALSDPVVADSFRKIHLDPTVLVGEKLVAAVARQDAAIGAVATTTPKIFTYFPHVVGGLCIGLVLLLITGSRVPKKDSRDAETSSENSAAICFAFAAAGLAYILALSLGSTFVITTVLFACIASCLIVGWKMLSFSRTVAVLLFGLAIGFGCHAVFTRIFSIALP